MDGATPVTAEAGYEDPVRKLLYLGDATLKPSEPWPDYISTYGLGAEHTDTLIRMACDAALNHAHRDSSLIWAPVHAWRALGQLQAEAAVQPLLDYRLKEDDDDTADSELPDVFGLIGQKAIAPLTAFVLNPLHETFAVATAIGGLQKIAEAHPENRSACVDVLAQRLRSRARADDVINAYATLALVKLHAVEAIDSIRDAFMRNAVDISVLGDLEDVEIELGLREQRATPPPDIRWLRNSMAARGFTEKAKKIGRNDPCPCGSGKKYKKCCLP